MFVSVHLLVPGHWTVQRGHDLAEVVEQQLREVSGDGASVLTHLEPLDDRSRTRTWSSTASAGIAVPRRRDLTERAAYDEAVTVDARSAAGRPTVPPRRARRASAGRRDAPEAFDEDALSRWIYRDHPDRLRWVRADFRLRLAQHGADGLCFTDAQVSGAAVWAAPGKWKGHAAGQMRALLAVPRVVRNHERIGAMQRELDRRHPAVPHLYLALLGVRRDRRRTGLRHGPAGAGAAPGRRATAARVRGGRQRRGGRLLRDARLRDHR